MAVEKLGLSSRAIIGRFFQRLEAGFDRSWASRLGMLFQSDQASETYKWLGMSPAMREWVDGRQAKGLRSNGLTIENKMFEATLAIALKDLQRDKTGQIMVRVDEMADRANSHWEKLLSDLILAGETGDCYDALKFFAANHSEADSGTQLNLVTKTQVAGLEVTTTTAPTAAEMADAIMGVIGYFYQYKDDQGEPINGAAQNFLVMVPVLTTWWASTVTAVSANLLNKAAGSLDNPLQGAFRQGINVEVVANPRINTWTESFAVFRIDGSVRPFILQEEDPVTVDALAEGSDEEFKNNRHLYGVKASRNVGYGYWQHAIKATLG
jgi:phage major head subunit gpT-like protein